MSYLLCTNFLTLEHTKLSKNLQLTCTTYDVRMCPCVTRNNVTSDKDLLIDSKAVKESIVGISAGRLHDSLLKWIHPSPNGRSSVYGRLNSEEWLRRGLTIMMEEYLRWGKPNCTESYLCQDDLRVWEETARRWTRVIAIGVVSNETQQKLVLVTKANLLRMELIREIAKRWRVLNKI